VTLLWANWTTWTTLRGISDPKWPRNWAWSSR